MSDAIGISGVGRAPPPRPDPATAAANFLAKVDTKKQGFVDAKELQSAVSGAAAGQGAEGQADAASADALFKKLDGNGDGKLSKDELSAGFKKLEAVFDDKQRQLDAGRSRLKAGRPERPPPPPPPPRDSAGTSAARVFDPADTNHDGTVSAAELLAYQISTAAKASAALAAKPSGQDKAISSPLQSGQSASRTLAALARAYGDADQHGGQERQVSATA
jgi:Ca2+-binding EF-hand superfamily protein